MTVDLSSTKFFLIQGYIELLLGIFCDVEEKAE